MAESSQAQCKMCAAEDGKLAELRGDGVARDEAVKNVSSNKWPAGHDLSVKAHNQFNFCQAHLASGRNYCLEQMAEGKKRKAAAAAAAAAGGGGVGGGGEAAVPKKAKTTDGKLRRVHAAGIKAIEAEATRQGLRRGFQYFGHFTASTNRTRNSTGTKEFT